MHLNEPTWIIDGFNELIVDFLFIPVIYLAPQKCIWMSCKYNSNAKPDPGQHHSSFHLPAPSNAGLVFLLNFITPTFLKTADLQRGTPALHLNEAADGSCCDAGLGLVWRCYWIYMSFVCLIQKKNICFGFLKGQGCERSKNKTSAKKKSTMSSLDPSIIQVASFKCKADVPL